MMNRTIAIGDIHGCARTFWRLINRLDLEKTDLLVLLGDYIDRGPDSKGVINFILALKEHGYRVICLRGNHEELMFQSEQGFYPFNHWVGSGGDSTLESFGVDGYSELHPAYRQFFEETRLWHVEGKAVFAHAGLHFESSNLFDDDDMLLWRRDFADDQPCLGERRFIHGHTPIPLQAVLAQTGNCINLDAGCVYHGEREDMGFLVAYILETGEYVYVEHCEDTEGKDLDGGASL